MSGSQLDYAYSRAPSSFKLPQELIDLIIDQFDGEGDSDIPHLVAVSLVARSWNPRTRDHLFGSITINQDDFETAPACLRRIDDLCSLLKANPNLSRFVKSFCLFDVSTELFDHWNDCGDGEDIVVGTLSRLTCLKEFLFHGVESPRIPQPVYNAISSLVYQPHLNYLFLEDLHGIDIVSLVQNTNIETLILRACLPHLASEDGASITVPFPASTPPSPTRSLKRLDVMSCGKALKILFQNSTGTGIGGRIQLEDLCVATSDWDVDMDDAFSLLVASCHVKTVMSYRIEQDCFQSEEDPIYKTFPPTVFDFSPFPNMETLALTTIPPHFFHLDQGILNQLLQGLEQLSRQSSGSKLCGLDLHFDYDVDGEEEGLDEDYDIRQDLAEFAEGDTWSRLDNILLRPGLGKIERVTITFDFTPNKISNEEWASAKAMILEKMEGLNVRRKIVTIERSVSFAYRTLIFY